ncbi:hypothetical protein DFQ27_002415 [Actinomortierella ambigua]|uniref:RRM domain-containing protein n=1 Tax=Actinomortierella ambigua TaxID=1343610 RepID=A0A9P6Q7I5_9FUNG|nr:hypothetical protein DFQ27_002415 [Actinomortierella ambigua]
MSHLTGPTPSPMSPPRTTPSTPGTPSPTSDSTTSQHDPMIPRGHKDSDCLIRCDSFTDYGGKKVSVAEGAEESLERSMDLLELAEFGPHSGEPDDRSRVAKNASGHAPLRSRSVDRFAGTRRKEYVHDLTAETNEPEVEASEEATEQGYDTSDSESDKQSQCGPMEGPDHGTVASEHTAGAPTHARRVEEAQRAMAEAQNTIIDGRHIRIEQARDIRKILEDYGPVEDVSVLHDSSPSGSRRYALARFAYRDDAIKAFVTLRASSHWAVEWAPNTNTSSLLDRDAIFVGQLNPAQVTKEALRERFEPYGTIKGITLLNRGRLGTRAPIAYAFIEYSNDQEASEAIEHENGTEFQGHTISVQYRETNEYRLQRQSFLQQAHAAQSMSPMYYRPTPMMPSMSQSNAESNAAPPGLEEGEHVAAGPYQAYHEQGAPGNPSTHHSHTVYYGPPQPPVPSLFMNYHNPYGAPVYSIRGPKEERGGYGQSSAGPADCTLRPKQAPTSSTRHAGTYGPASQGTSRDQVTARTMTGMNANTYEYAPFVPMDPYYSYGAQPMVMYDYAQPMSPSAYGPYPAAGYYYSRPMPSPHAASTMVAGSHELSHGPHASATGWQAHHGPGGGGSGGSRGYRSSLQGGHSTPSAPHQGQAGGVKDSKSEAGLPVASSSRK